MTLSTPRVWVCSKASAGQHKLHSAQSRTHVTQASNPKQHCHRHTKESVVRGPCREWIMLAGWLARCVVSAPPHHDGYVCLANNATAAELEIMMGTLGSSGERGEHSRKHKLGITFFFLFPSVRLLLIHTYTNTHTHTVNTCTCAHWMRFTVSQIGGRNAQTPRSRNLFVCVLELRFFGVKEGGRKAAEKNLLDVFPLVLVVMLRGLMLLNRGS